MRFVLLHYHFLKNAGSTIENILDRNFDPLFSTKWMHKDVGMALDSGRRLGVPLPLTGITHQMFQAAVSNGHADEDFCSTIKLLEAWAGIEVKKS